MQVEFRSQSESQQLQQQLQDDVTKFLSNGGKVHELPPQEVTPRRLHSVRKMGSIYKIEDD